VQPATYQGIRGSPTALSLTCTLFYPLAQALVFGLSLPAISKDVKPFPPRITATRVADILRMEKTSFELVLVVAWTSARKDVV
jgi:hypothetical protein